MSLTKFKKLARPVLNFGGIVAASGLILYMCEHKLQQEHDRKVSLYQSQNYEVCSDNPDLYMKMSEPQSVTIRDSKGSISDSTKIDFKNEKILIYSHPRSAHTKRDTTIKTVAFKDIEKDVSLAEQKQAAEKFRKAKIQPL